MTARWALEMMGELDDAALPRIAREVASTFAQGASSPREVPELAALGDALRRDAPMDVIEPRLRELSHAGYLRGAIVMLAAALEQRPRADVALALARELMDAIDPALGIALCRAVLALPELEAARMDPGAGFTAANLLLGEALLERDDPRGALHHFEAVLSVDVTHRRALRGWSAASRALERRGIVPQHRSRGLALVDGLEELELSHGFGSQRYELGRPLGRGRHAVVYQAYDRHVGREVAIKRLLDPEARQDGMPGRVLESRFFSEARTLARVRSPHVVALLDVAPRHRFIALDLCRGGNLRLAMRRGLISKADLEQVARQLRAALEAVHAVGAVHRDVKPANILVRTPRQGSPLALADFGLAAWPVAAEATAAGPGAGCAPAGGHNAGTLRYLAPELRQGSERATPRTDRFSAGVVLLEIARAPAPLPEAFDRLDADFDATRYVPEDLPAPWNRTIRSLLSSDPDARRW
jgi:tRNA A-37 threonylcarbamoyl transferase component Bud32